MGSLSSSVLIIDVLADALHRWNYADGCKVAVAIYSTVPDYIPLQDAVDDLLPWTADNKVTVSYNKTVVMNFNIAVTQVQALAITFDGKTLQLVQCDRFMCATIY